MRDHLLTPGSSTSVLRGGVLLLLSLLLAGTALADAGARSSGPAASESPLPSDDLEMALTRFRDALVEMQRLHVEEFSANELIDAALEGIRQRIDAHANVLTPTEYENLRTAQGRSVGLGIEYDPTATYPLIRSLYDESPADLAGLRPGDRLLAMDGQDLASLDPAGVKAAMKGHEGESRAVLYVTPEGDVRTTEVRYARLPESALEVSRLFGGDLGYLRIRRFSAGLSRDIAPILAAWQEEQLGAVILDLRDCPGGFLDEAIEAADLFLPQGAFIAATTGRLEDENETFLAHGEPYLTGAAVAILVDSLTASSAELFAGALQGNDRAVLLGEQTYGKREIQRIKRLSDGAAVKVTTSLFRTPADGNLPIDDIALRRELSGSRLQPDHLCVHPVFPRGWDEIEAQGLLARFIQEASFPSRGLPYQSPWSGLRPSLKGTAPASALLEGPGFDLWMNRLEYLLETWGVQRTEIRLLDLGVDDPRVVRRAWVIDWAAERWGSDVARQLELHTDLWLLQAAELLQKGGTRLFTASSSPPR